MQPEELRPLFPWLAVVAVTWLAAEDSIRAINLGGITLSGVATLAVAALSLIQSGQLLLNRPRAQPYRQRLHPSREPKLPRTRLTRPPIAVTLALLYMLTALALRPTADGVQNVTVYVAFFLGTALVADSVSAGSWRRISNVALQVGAAATLIAIGTFSTGILVYGTRPFALGAIPILAFAIPEREGGWLIRWLPYLTIVAVALSLSRTALFLCVGLMVFRVVRRPPGARSWKAIAGIVAAGVALYFVVDAVPALRDRFTEQGDNATVAGIHLNTSGRVQFWQFTWDSAMTHPWFGGGPGSADALITRLFPPNTHPHSDWLRLLHDFGWIGGGLFLLGYLTLILRAARRARVTDATIHWSALIGLLGVGGAAITDNVLTYPFVMVPLAVIVGLSLAAPDPDLSSPGTPAAAMSSRTPAPTSGRSDQPIAPRRPHH